MTPHRMLVRARGVDITRPVPPPAGGTGHAVPGLAAGAFFLIEHEHA
jgi:hypothetical protein